MQVVDRMGFTNSFGYDAVRHMTGATNANGVVTRYTYCSCGSLESVTNAFGTPVQQVTHFSYDNQGNRVQTLGPDNYAVFYNHNALGQVTNVWDAVSSVTNWYNNQGLLAASYNAAGRVAAAIYDPLDRVTNSTGANGVTITNTFDALNRLRTRGYPDQGVELFGYTFGIAGVTSYTNQVTNIVNYAYDRFGETKIDDDHQLTDDTYPVAKFVDGQIVIEHVPALTALNMRLRDDYSADCAKGVERWNKIIQKEGIDFRLELPHQAFNRQIGEFAPMQATPKGIILSEADWAAKKDEYLPSRDDLAYLDSLMKAEVEPGQYAGWINPPKVGIDNKPGDFEYVKIAA